MASPDTTCTRLAIERHALPSGISRRGHECRYLRCTAQRRKRVASAERGKLRTQLGNQMVRQLFTLGPLKDMSLELGMHAEAEFAMDGTVTIFAGPKGDAKGKIGDFGGDFGVKDGLYAVIGRDGVQDVGFRVVIGGGVDAGPAGGTHDVDSMDFSFVSAI